MLSILSISKSEIEVLITKMIQVTTHKKAQVVTRENLNKNTKIIQNSHHKSKTKY